MRKIASFLHGLFIIFAFLSMATGVLWAQAPEKDAPSKCLDLDRIEEPKDNMVFNVTIDNDGGIVVPSGTDRHYTHGTRFNFWHQPECIQPILNFDPFRENFKTAWMGYSLGQNIYTPEDIASEDLQEEDRPYAGWLYLGMFIQRASETSLEHLELDLGIVGGRSGAKQTQEFVHLLLGAQEPKGWGHQIQDEPACNVVYTRKWKIDLLDAKEGFGCQLIPYAGGVAGLANRHFAGGGTLRLGWNLPRDFGAARGDDVAVGPISDVAPWGVYAFVRAGGRIVEENMFIEGNNFRDSHGMRENLLVGEIQGGVAAQITDFFELVYSVACITEEFEGQQGPDLLGTYSLKFSW